MAEHIFLKSENRSYSYSQLNIFTSYFISFLEDRSYQKGPIGILADSCDEMVLIIAACWKAGIPFVCFNPDEKKQVLKKQITALNPIIIFTDNLERLKESSLFININKLSSEHWSDFNDTGYNVETSRNDIFGYFFTSGTTSKPKAVPLKRRQLLAAAYASTQNMQLDKNDFWLLCMPLYHIGGVSIILRSIIYESAVYRVNKFDSSVSELLSSNAQIKAASLVPTVLKRLIDRADFVPHRFLKILLGGGPAYKSLLSKCLENNIHVITSYGMTETCAQIAAGPITKRSVAKGSIGSIFESNRIQIRNEKKISLPANTVGTIWLKGPQVFDGYFQAEHQTKFDENGWFNTGDFGYLDKDNQLHVESRRTDLIVTGGENVSPFEVEEALLELNEIEEAAVIGIPHEEWGESVVAVVVAETAKKLSPDKIKQSLKTTLTNYKIPKNIFIADQIPRTDTGKIQRDEVKLLFRQKLKKGS